MDTSIAGIKPPDLPITGVAFTISLKYMKTLRGTHRGTTTSNRLTMLTEHRKSMKYHLNLIWKTVHPSPPTLAHYRFQVRYTNWQPSSLRERIRAARHLVILLHKMASRQRGVCVCVCVHCYSHAENHNWTFDDYACYGFRIHALKTMYVMFSEFMRQRLFTSRGLQGMS